MSSDLKSAKITTLQAISCVTVFLIECIRCRRKAVSTVLSSYLGCGPEDLPLSISPFGKWKLFRPSSEFPIEFSVSPCDRRCLIAVSSGGDVGIDVERRRVIGDLDGVANIYFTPAEAARISALQDDRSSRRSLPVGRSRRLIRKPSAAGF